MALMYSLSEFFSIDRENLIKINVDGRPKIGLNSETSQAVFFQISCATPQLHI